MRPASARGVTASDPGTGATSAGRRSSDADTRHPAEQRVALECRPTISPGASSFKAGRSAQDGLLSEAAPHDLQTDRQAIVSKADRDAGSRLTGEIERVGEEWLQRAGNWLTCDFRWAKDARSIRGCGNGWRQEQLVLLEEADEQIMHRILPIDGREDIAGGHLLCKREEGLNDRVQLLCKAWRKLLLKLYQQTGDNHPEKNLVHVGEMGTGLFDNAAELLKGAGGCLTAFQHLRVNATIAWRGTPGDTHPLDITIACLEIAAGLIGQGEPVALIGTGHNVQQRCRVTHCASDRPFMVEGVPAIVAWPGWDAPELWLQAIDPAHGGWDTDRATSIIAHRQRPHPGSDLCCCTSRRAARRTTQIPGIVGGPEHLIIRRKLSSMIRGIGFRENRTSSRPYSFDQDGVVLRYKILPQQRTKGRAYPPGFYQILNTRWHTT